MGVAIYGSGNLWEWQFMGVAIYGSGNLWERKFMGVAIYGSGNSNQSIQIHNPNPSIPEPGPPPAGKIYNPNPPTPDPRTAAGRENQQSKSASVVGAVVGAVVVATRESRLCRQIRIITNMIRYGNIWKTILGAQKHASPSAYVNTCLCLHLENVNCA